MTTRRVKPGSRRTQNGWASAPEFEESRGLNGSAVAFKAPLVDDVSKRELLFFLQAQSLKEGGIRRIARELLEMFPERVGTPTMVKIGCKPGKRLSQKERDEIYDELNPSFRWALLDDKEERAHCQSTADEFLSECYSRLENGLPEFLERLCCDPKLEVSDDETRKVLYRKIVKIVLEDAGREDESESGFEIARLSCFHDVLGALIEYQHRCEKKVRAEFVETSIGTVVFEALDYALETGRSALIEGNSGVGKTTSLKAWCEMHSGRARYVALKGITHRTGFFRELARAFGVARGTGLSASKVQHRVEQFLQRSKVLLVIDEGQYLFPPGNRVYTPPELINWLLTACYNEGVPFVISATSEFTDRRAVVEKNTTWQSEQLRRRIRRYFDLPKVPTKDDLTRIAQKLLPGFGRETVDYVVGYSMVSRGFFQAITDAIEDARLIASRAGRAEIKFADLKAAIQDWRSPSDAALQRVFETKPQARRGRRPAVESDERQQPETEAILRADNVPLSRLSVPLETVERREISLVPG